MAILLLSTTVLNDNYHKSFKGKSFAVDYVAIYNQNIGKLPCYNNFVVNNTKW